MALLTVVNGDGHTVLEYNKTDEADIEKVRSTFDDMIAKGNLGYADGVPTQDFDPEAENVLVTPVVAGG